MLREALASCDRILAAARESGKKICYAENWVYAPAIEKEREILAKTAGQILWIIGRRIAQRVALALLRHLEILRRRLAGGQRLPSADRGAPPEAGGGRSPRRQADPARHSLRAHSRDHAAEELSATPAFCAPVTMTWRTTARCTSPLRMGPWPISFPPSW